MSVIRMLLMVTVLSHLPGAVLAQRQLVVLRGEDVMLRLNPGDDFAYRLKDDDQVRRSYINNLFEDAVLVHQDTVPLHRIERVYFRRTTFANRFGLFLTIGGAAFFLIDQLNQVVVEGNDPSLEPGVTVPAAIMVGAGVPMMLSGRKYQVMRGRKRLMIVDKTSLFYSPF